MNERCPWAIKFGVTLHTRCQEVIGHPGSHAGRGLEWFPYQHIEWFPGDQREYQTDRVDEHAWQE